MSNAVNLRIDPDTLTIGDLEDFEMVTGKPMFDVLKPVQVRDDEGQIVRGEDGRPETEVKVTAVALKALVWISQRAENPAFTLDDARNVRVAALEIVGDDEGEGEGGTPA
jgi:hypothetical protein